MSDVEQTTASTWLASGSPIPRLLAGPVRRFLQTEIAGGIALLVFTVIALIWANSPWGDSYESLWHTEVGFTVGTFELSESLQHWVNDGLMTLFFFVVGLEIKRELVRGELNEVRKAALPIAAAAGGMIVPALIFFALNAGTGASSGWGVPMATDIAFAVGVLALVAPNAPTNLKIFLLSLAVVDDIGAILVIAIFYSTGVQASFLLGAFALLGVVVVLRRMQVWWMPVYVVIGVGLWYMLLESGVHATLAGVAMGLFAPVTPLDLRHRRRVPLFEDEEHEDFALGLTELPPQEAMAVKARIDASTSVAERLEFKLHPWTSYVIVPLFALANAGVVLKFDTLGTAFTSRVTLGVIFGLVVGKIIGVLSFTYGALKLGVGVLPVGMTRRDLFGVSALAGIGFTVALFITSLAFEDPVFQDEAKVGILVASLLATLLGASIFRGSSRGRGGVAADASPGLEGGAR
ncbi:MAG: Na+/H+ antiporter NhaA [Actinomycetota bacterium]